MVCRSLVLICFGSSILATTALAQSIVYRSTPHILGETVEVPQEEETSIVFPESTTRNATVGAPFALDLLQLSSVDNGDVSGLSFSANGMPSWLELSSGALLGTPYESGTTNFIVTASHPDVKSDASGSFTIVVEGIALHVRQISASSSHTCALDTNSQVWCWGSNSVGQLGNGLTTGSDRPVQVRNVEDTGALDGVTSISTRSGHTCAVTVDTKAICWGSRSRGKRGDGSTSEGKSTPSFVRNASGTGDLAGVTSISAGNNHTCAIASGKALCWGQNMYGELGNGSSTDTSLPVAVRNGNNTSDLEEIDSISVGATHTCAVTVQGEGLCWGLGGNGRLGNGGTTARNLPGSVRNSSNSANLGGIVSISAGSVQSCARMSNGQAFCWGQGVNGELGNGGTSSSSLPVSVRSVDNNGILTGVSSIHAGGNHACAIIVGGKAICWGHGTSGQLGNGVAARSTVPVSVGLDGVVASISAGGQHSCAVVEDGVFCWGGNDSGQLGNASLEGSSSPAPVAEPLARASATSP